MTRRQRMNVYFEPGLLKQVEALAERRKVSKSAVIEAAVLSLVSGEDDGRRDAALSKRLDRLGRRIDDVDEAVAVLGEAFALYTHAWMMRQLPIPANENEAAKDRGAEMYVRFNEVLVRRLARGQRFLNERVRDVAGRRAAGTGT
ncbi:putative regulator protein [Gluconacetobacter diazotrophicus PA1 5]|uniref:ribbon-helix-helix domain-containing protein n=1 Tax=Gluconacetobacter diazotrophicus TaxID=33996 RepID=UPI000173BC49|nr:CopG family transcriptional regulator [Gluconacetobacter diazotrophicus]ACI50849.1 putative regulator protein [Gluconacetobacter diazotrophicus PA1 5]